MNARNISDNVTEKIIDFLQKAPLIRIAILAFIGMFCFLTWEAVPLLESRLTDKKEQIAKVKDDERPELSPGQIIINFDDYLILLKRASEKEKAFNTDNLVQINRIVREVDKALKNLAKNTGADRAALIKLSDSDIDIIWGATKTGPHKFYYDCYRSFVSEKYLVDYCHDEFLKKPYEVMVDISEKLLKKHIVRYDFSKVSSGWIYRFMCAYNIGSVFFYPVFSLPDDSGHDVYLGFLMIDFENELQQNNSYAGNLAIYKMMLSTANTIQLSLAVGING